MSNNSWQPAISFSWIAFIFSWCCSDAAFIQHVLGKLTSPSSLQVLVVPVRVSGLESSRSWRSEKSHCSSGKVSKSEIKPKAWRNSTEARSLKSPCKKSYWNPESMLNEWAGSPGRERAQGQGTARVAAEIKHDTLTVQEWLVRRTATEVITILSAASRGPKAIVRGDCREGMGKRGGWVLRWIQGRVLFPTDEHLTKELLHTKAEHVLVPLKRLSGKHATQPHGTKHLEQQPKHLRSSSLGVPLRNVFPCNSLQLWWVCMTSLVGGLSPFLSIYQPNKFILLQSPIRPLR